MASTSHSLLEQIQGARDGLAWQRWHSIYEPLIRNWLHRHRMAPADRDDVVQNALAVVVRRIPEFQHNGRTGAFRTWLKTITIFCLRDHWKDLRAHPQQAAALSALDEWAADTGLLSQAWDREHDVHVMQKLLALLQSEFAPETWKAFYQVAVEGRAARDVAESVGLTVNAVYIAKSRVLGRLRQEAAGLLDDPVDG